MKKIDKDQLLQMLNDGQTQTYCAETFTDLGKFDEEIFTDFGKYL